VPRERSWVSDLLPGQSRRNFNHSKPEETIRGPDHVPSAPFSFSLLVAIGTNAQALPTPTVRFHGSTQRLGDAVGVGAEPGVIVLGPVADSAGNSQLRAISQFAADGAIIIRLPLMVIGSSSGSPTSASANCF
jgi:hypothetical protein